MSKETESGRRSLSLIARLMGLDGLPASHNINKKQKRLSDNNQRGSNSAGVSKYSKPLDSRHRKNARAPQQFKDVFEVKDGSYMATRSTTSRALSDQNLSEDEIAFIRQKFMDAKCLSTDDRSHHSKEFDDAPEGLNSNKHLLGADSKNSVKSNIDVIECQAGEVSQKIDISHSYKRHSSCYNRTYDKHAADLQKLSFCDELNVDASLVPTKIVLLKPNLGKTRNVSKSALANTTCDPKSDSVFYHDNHGRKSEEAKELARGVTRQMKNKLGIDSFNFLSSGYKGYSADESSYDTSENDSSDESEMTFVSSFTSSNRTVRRKSSSVHYMESSVTTEAKKRLSERWKSTHRFQGLGESSKSSTLADMLAIPDVDIRPQSPEITYGRDECFYRCGRSDGTTELNTPLGISSRDGWKDGSLQNLSRSKSLPTSVNRLGSPRSSTNCEALAAERFLIRKEIVSHGRNKAVRREARRKDRSFLEFRKPSDEKSQSSLVNLVNLVDDAYEMQSSDNVMKITSDGKDSPEVKTVILETPSCRPDTCLPLDGNVPLSQDGSSSLDMPPLPQVEGSSCSQCNVAHLEPSTSSKESEQPSPASVLEAPFVEDLSSGSECFERVSADLHGLRIQLQLLKRESEDYDGGSILISSDEYVEDSVEFTPRNGGCWEFWYLVDVLALSGLDKPNSELFISTWHSPDCPIGSWVFEDLEKRYCESESCSRSERRLLFDHINARIMDISQQYVDTNAWVKKPGKAIDPRCLKDMLKNELHNVLDNHQNKLTEKELDTVLLSEMQWNALEEHVSDVGKDIEGLLMNELVTECLPV
ncbi:uncharacterized protein LOC130813395 isoform X2 [Amaranthus tricolor]|uniref:uncharacterized protein LOC130813395 isoform X2 n=1 Tax=Amaranthus tricolor TaxID=29722 RepID=UPI00258E0A5E|nr:uncharacterized protein LOC130813395 isoform X2 [Amaranthus tricolor]